MGLYSPVLTLGARTSRTSSSLTPEPPVPKLRREGGESGDQLPGWWLELTETLSVPASQPQPITQPGTWEELVSRSMECV